MLSSVFFMHLEASLSQSLPALLNPSFSCSPKHLPVHVYHLSFHKASMHWPIPHATVDQAAAGHYSLQTLGCHRKRKLMMASWRQRERTILHATEDLLHLKTPVLPVQPSGLRELPSS